MIHRLGATDIAQAVRTGDLRATDIVEASLERIAELEPRIHAFLDIDAEGAREQARAVDERRRRGEELGPLAGVPVAIKDNLAVADRPFTCASKMLESFVAPRDAHAVERLREAGAVIVGKTDLDEFAMGSSGEHSALSPAGGVRNPRDLSRVPGGSSSGSAAAVAAGMVPVALGSDTGGSLRQPAAFCGAVGLEPTWGRVSRRGLVAFASSLDCVGPVTRSVDDAALVLSVIAGHDPRDATSVARDPSEALDDGSTVDGLRVGVVRRDLPGWAASDEIDERFDAAMETLREMGCRLEEVSIDGLEVAGPCYRVLSAAEASANLARYDGVRYGLRVGGETVEELHRRSRGAGFGAEVKRRIILGTYALSAEQRREPWAQAERVRQALRRSARSLLAVHDVLALPTTPTVAFRRGARDHPLSMYASDTYTIPASLAGLPALAVPCGRGRQSGMPASLQLVGRSFDEATILRLGRAFEAVHGVEGVAEPEAG